MPAKMHDGFIQDHDLNNTSFFLSLRPNNAAETWVHIQLLLMTHDDNLPKLKKAHKSECWKGDVWFDKDESVVWIRLA